MSGRTEAVALVGIGGFAGANLRYAVDLAVGSGLAATLLVNVLGSLALAVLLYESVLIGRGSQRARLTLATGFLSSFTTYSTFVIVTVQSAPLAALGYVLVSYALGFAAVGLGKVLVTRVLGGSA